MKIGVLTSSRADFGIYLPLLKRLKNDTFFNLGLLVFGTHLSSVHGYTINHITKEGFRIDYTLETVMLSDTPEAIAKNMAQTGMKFSAIWESARKNYDVIFCLGDRYEMFAAVSVSVPFEITIAHLHGGETTLGAIDNKFRHCLTHFATMHFASTYNHAKRVETLTGSPENIYNTGALSLDNINDLKLIDAEEMLNHFGIDFSIPTLLVTYHPETAGEGVKETGGVNMVEALKFFDEHQVVITMPNADTSAGELRTLYQEFSQTFSSVKLIENFGTQGYFSAMKLSKLVIGNSSSGIIEAASFNKYVINIGYRQGGRAVSDNVINTSNSREDIKEGINKGLSLGEYKGINIYNNGGAVNKIIEVLKSWQK